MGGGRGRGRGLEVSCVIEVSYAVGLVMLLISFNRWFVEQSGWNSLTSLSKR